VNLAREQACDVAIRLLQRDASNPKSVALAEELLRFSEDQFVVWEAPKPEWKEIVYMGCNPDGDTTSWITPAVLEQYRCYGPVARSIGIMIDGWRAAYLVTHKELYMAKARSLANTMTIAQQYWKNGTYPTWVRKSEGEKWMNNVVHTARLMLDFAAVEERAR
jgi:maltose/maltodextrin transport system substrate-binding protein